MLSQVPPTDCMRAREGVSARLDGELSELETAWVDGHLVECAVCAAFAAEIAAGAAVLRSAPLEPAPAVFVPHRRRVPLALTAAVASLVVAAAAGTSFVVGQHFGAQAAGRTVEPLQAVVAGPRIDPGLLAMLRGLASGPASSHHAIAL
jgi:predicted anti-sigma-YlaC factor YlaD